MGQIYIAYRRDDSAAISGRVADRLRALFGPQAVMKDVTDERAGDSMERIITGAVYQCSAMVALIGPNWLSGMLANQYDQTHVEIITALRQNMPVVPVLAHGATLPDWRLLPQTLWPLVSRGCLTLGDETTFDRDTATLAETLRRMMPPVGFRPPATASSGRGPALPGEVGVQARRASLGRRALLIGLVIAVLIASCGGGGILMARRIAVTAALNFPQDMRLLDIANPPGTDDAWVVGGNFGACVLLHYSGGIWSRVSCPLSGDLDSVSFVNSGEGWAVGGDYNTCRLLHFHGGSWSPVTCPVSALDTPEVRMDAHGGGWITGDNNGKNLLRYVGGAWTVYQRASGNGLEALRTLAVSGQGDAWATGDATFHEASKGVWANVSTPLLNIDAFFESMDFSRTDDTGWAVGYTGLLQRAYIAEYTHGQWQPYTPLPSVGQLTLVRIGLFGDVWATGGAESKDSLLPTGLILRYDGRQWVTQGDPASGTIYGITDLPDGDAWAVGDKGDNNFGPVLLWYHNGFWRVYHS